MSIFGVGDDRASVRYSPLEQQEGSSESGHLLGDTETAVSYMKKIVRVS